LTGKYRLKVWIFRDLNCTQVNKICYIVLVVFRYFNKKIIHIAPLTCDNCKNTIAWKHFMHFCHYF